MLYWRVISSNLLEINIFSRPLWKFRTERTLIKKGILRVRGWCIIPLAIIADVAVMKRHQRLDEIRIIFTLTSFKSCFQKSSIMQCMPSTLYAIHIAHHICLRACYKCASYTQHTLVWNVCVLAEKQLCWFQYSVGKKYHDFILSLMAFPYSNICNADAEWLIHSVFMWLSRPSRKSACLCAFFVKGNLPDRYDKYSFD